MIIKDTQGMYELKVDTMRNIVFEQLHGLWDVPAMERYHNDYQNKVVPLLKGKKWCKCCDVRNYKTSSVSDGGNKHLEWCYANGMSVGALIVDNVIVKMQMSRAAKGTNVGVQVFTSIEEAEEWLKSNGF